MSQTFAKEKPSALYLVDQSEIRGRIPDEKRRECNAVWVDFRAPSGSVGSDFSALREPTVRF